MTVDELLERLDKVKRHTGPTGVYWMARCPAHDDKNPSLKVDEGHDRRVLLDCKAGCTFEAIVAALGLEQRDLFPPANGKGEPVAVYDYVDEHGLLLFQVCRFPDKRFLQRRPDSGGGWIWRLGDTRRVLYRSDRLAQATANALFDSTAGVVYVVEGEKDVHAAERAGAIATTNPQGAGKWRLEYVEQLRGFERAVVVADRDVPGRAHAIKVAESLRAVVEQVDLVEPAEGKDLSDHLAAGRTLDELVPLAPSDDQSTPGLEFVQLGQFAAVEEADAEPLATDQDGEPLAPAGSIIVVYGEGGAGKSTFVFDVAVHLAAGENWLDVIRPAKKLTIAIIENEGPRAMLRRKLKRKLAAGWQHVADRVYVMTAPWQKFNFRDELQRETLAAFLNDNNVDLVIVGPVSRVGMKGGGTLDEIGDFMIHVADVQRRLKQPTAILLVHHTNRAGDISGAWEGEPDLLVHVQKQGNGRTRIYWQKARWSSLMHATATQLLWADGDTYTIEDKPEVTEDTIAADILAAARDTPGASWSKIRERVTGKSKEAAKVRDRLITAGELVNTAARDGYFNLEAADTTDDSRSQAGTGRERHTAPSPNGASAAEPFPVPPIEGTEERNGLAGTGIDQDEIERLAALAEDVA